MSKPRGWFPPVQLPPRAPLTAQERLDLALKRRFRTLDIPDTPWGGQAKSELRVALLQFSFPSGWIAPISEEASRHEVMERLIAELTDSAGPHNAKNFQSQS